MFKSAHMNVSAEDCAGNNGIGRYVLLPGSDGRAREIAEHFTQLQTQTHPRGHTFYSGLLEEKGRKIAVASIASGMGCPSTEIIVHELFQLGITRFLRVGTAGSLQSNFVEVGDLINVQAAVRDEDTTTRYLPIEVPAVASLEFVTANLLAGKHLDFAGEIHTGIVHCKSALYAREMGVGPRSADNQAYLHLLTQAGVLASEMETAALFIQAQLYHYQRMQKHQRVLAGAILAVVDGLDSHFKETKQAQLAIQNAIQLSLESIKILASQEDI